MTSNRLPVLAARINEEHGALVVAASRALQHALTIGELLKEAKASLAHGEWAGWLQANCAIPDRTARLYMRLAKNREVIETEAATVADLTVRAAAALVAVKQPTFRDAIEDIEAAIANIRWTEDKATELAATHGPAAVALHFYPVWEAAVEELRQGLVSLDRALRLARTYDQLHTVRMYSEIARAAAFTVREHGIRGLRALGEAA